ncbi:YajG family lipoprotein [Pseudoalteromonas tunicata]|uniref:Putative lipoprotein n=1 Tax=Pseudoalteromonas tunicata D2 TaxID=87626 RepID=A4C6S9_9GAMM|nr:YajG family lipoprotein [Pseudoalteromonas tunicata]ATC95655.1 putative lipoprotein [Pseudoalteromonas tunicata]AXT31219.1 hypothetical protein D1819_10640 [Pseudoalteromonas tunicata]EAR29683.1 putative lipoprotein [Pseudoalteromonas tunicata D2]MDP4985017.1 YajG family lipoprotein [Pseudoalteromonas tunicata]MDP5214864.1 YajG family lipoprotein [Pseudoalteromonas tunicata]
MRAIILAASLLTLAACQNSPSQIIIQPNYTAVGNQLVAKSLNVTVTDARSSQSSLKILTADGTTTLPSNNLQTSLQRSFEAALERHGANTKNPSNTLAELKIHQLEAIVKQQTLKYRSEAIIELELIVTKGQRTFAKYYNGDQHGEGPLLHDKAKIESDLNTLLEQLISRMVTDVEFKEFLED